MILYKSPIIGIIKKIISKILLGVYKIVSVFHLKATALVLAVGVLLLVTGSFGAEPVLKTVFLALLGVSLFYALAATAGSFLKFGKKVFGKRANDPPDGLVETQVEKESGRERDDFAVPRAEAVDRNDGYGDDGFAERRNATAYENGDVLVAEKRPFTATVYPKYYSVRQNRDYVMAEYEDRYELFVKRDGGLQKVRTDYKKQREE